MSPGGAAALGIVGYASVPVHSADTKNTEKRILLGGKSAKGVDDEGDSIEESEVSIQESPRQ